jgi:hypothetical protein
MARPHRRIRPFLAALMLAAGASTGNAAAAEALKPPLEGLLFMGDIRFNRQDGGLPSTDLDELAQRPGLFDGLVLNFTWAQLQPESDRIDFEPVDRALEQVRKFNAQHPDARLALRLRIWHGAGAPNWAKALGGTPIAVRHRDVAVTVGRFWGAPYRAAWRQLQARLGARYDAEPLIRAVSNTSCSSITNEPFVFPGDADSLKHLREAGFNDADFLSCLGDSAQDYAAWPTTRVDFPFNPYRAIDSGRPRQDLEVTRRLMREWRQKMGARGVLANESVQFPPPPLLAPVYEEMKRLGPPIELQTHSPKGLDWDATVRYAASIGAGAVELWGDTRFGGYRDVPPENLKRWSGLLKANRQP